MLLWRISQYASLSGICGELSSGRWHTMSADKRIVYLAEHPAVALIENLANLGGPVEFFPDEFQLLKIHARDKVIPTQLTSSQIENIDPQDFSSTQSIGDMWLAFGSSALLRVPSIPSPESWNYLLNPLHPDAHSLQVDWARTIAYDKRLFQFKED